MKHSPNLELPYYAVIFTSRKNLNDDGYSEMAKRMELLSASSPGFLGIESARTNDGFGITVSYWKSVEDIRQWKIHEEHQEAQSKGQMHWYQSYQVRICKVERHYNFGDL